MSDSASKWKFADFNNLGILYNENPDDLTFFSGIIEKKFKDNPNFDKCSLLGDTFVEFTAKYWKKSIDLNNVSLDDVGKVYSLVDSAEDLDNDLSDLKSEYDQNISFFLPADTEMRKKALEMFARYIEFHFHGIN